MPSADEPNIKIEYSNDAFPPSTWTELQDYAVSFQVRDAGVLKVPTANIFLHNFGGRFTDVTNDLYLKNYGIIRIRANIRDSICDTLFYGRIYSKRDPLSGSYFIGGFGSGFGAGFQVGTGGSRSTVEVFCKDIGAQKLLDQTKTYSEGQGYASQKIKCKDAIEHFLANPDSGIDTNITLETDNGLITTTDFPRDPNKDTLLDLLRQVADAIGYDGYCYVNGSNQLKLYFKEAGNEETNPVITLQRPFKTIEPNYDLDEIANIVFVWGNTDVGVPPDVWTQNGIAKYPSAWTSPSNATLSDVDPPDDQNWSTDNCVKMLRTTSIGELSATLDLNQAGYKNVLGNTYIDCTWFRAEPQLKRFTNYKVKYRGRYTAGGTTNNFLTPSLFDTEGNEIYYGGAYGAAAAPSSEMWTHVDTPVGQDQTIYPYADAANPAWHYQTGVSSFNWKVAKLKWRAGYINSNVDADSYFYIDYTEFTGQYKIDPILYPELNPKIEDLTGGTIPEPKVYHHEDEKITNFEIAQTIGQYVLAIKKNLTRKVTVTKSAYTWMKPHQFLRLYHPEHNIAYNEKYRILEIQQDWTTEKKVLRTTFDLIKRSDVLDSTAIKMTDIAGLLAKVKG
jgi:hypothetical protein